MRVPFVKLSPNGNTTILLRGPFSQEEHTRLTSRVIEADHLGAEQSGVISMADVPCLNMMAGEFCLNATRAFAALLALEGKLEGMGPHKYGSVRVSGVDGLVKVRVEVQDEAHCHASIRLRLPKRPETQEVEPGALLVHIPGISHLILDTEQHPLPQPHLLQDEAARWRERLQCTASAVGVVWTQRQTAPPCNTGRCLHIVPAVWVSSSNTTCVETACGSGSLAAAIADKQTGTTGLWQVSQSGGTLDVNLAEDDEGFAAWVGGDVWLTAAGDAFFED